jgi:hypothetical protein
MRRIFMSATLPPLDAPQKTARGWVIQLPDEFAQALNMSVGSIALLHAKDGSIEVEILPPPSADLPTEARETYEELKDAFAEMKRRGD